MTKGRPTPKQRTALRRMREQGEALREWLQGRRDSYLEPDPTPPGGHGITRAMRSIRRRPPEWVHKHTAPAGWERRHKRLDNGRVVNRSVPLFASNTPYVNPDRDSQRRTRRALGKRAAAVRSDQ